MSKQSFNIGLIGYGLSAKIFHIPFVQAVHELKLYAIVQRRPRAGNDARQDHPQVKVYGSSAELVRDQNVDVVVVNTAPESHFALAKEALEARKHVVVEKPFTPTLAEAEELAALAKRQRVVLTVYQNRRWDSDYLTLRHYMDNGSLGRIAEFESHFDRHRPEVVDPANWKYQVAPGTGAIYDLGSHLIDQVVHTFGVPKQITGFLGAQRRHNPTGLQDSCTVLLHYDQLLVTVKAGVVSPEVEQLRFWVRGEKGSFKKYHLDRQEDQLKEGMRPGDQGYGVDPKDHYGTLNTVQDGKITSQKVPTLEPQTYVEFYRKLARALAGNNDEVPVDLDSAVAVIRLIELAQQSFNEGRTLTV